MGAVSGTSPDLEPPWGRHGLAAGATTSVGIGPLTLWARSRAGEVWLAHDSGDWADSGRAVDTPEPPPEEEGWVRWPVPEGTGSLRLSPVFPPRTLVVKPELSFRLLPRSGARIYVRVPLWARVEATGGDRDVTLTEVPTVVLSDTWWGEFTDGELCYWLPTSARRSAGSDVFSPHQAICPLDLSNRSEKELEVEKIALRVAHLSVFRGEQGFWSDVTRVRYRGESEGSDIEVSGKPPQEAAEDVRRVASPRTPLSKSFRVRTFSRLRTLSGLGGM